MSLSTLQRKNRAKYVQTVAAAVVAVRNGMSPQDAAAKFSKGFRVRKGSPYADDPEQIFSNGLATVMDYPETEDGFTLPGLAKIKAAAEKTFESIKPPVVSGSGRVSTEDQLAESEDEIAKLIEQLGL